MKDVITDDVELGKVRRHVSAILEQLHKADPEALDELMSHRVQVRSETLRAIGVIPVEESGGLGTIDVPALLIAMFDGCPLWLLERQKKLASARQSVFAPHQTRAPRLGQGIPASQDPELGPLVDRILDDNAKRERLE